MVELLPRTFDEMCGLLDEVDAHLDDVGTEGTMYVLLVVGGLAMAAIQDDRTTQDIDVVLSAIAEPVADAAKLVAKRHGISTGWMNNQVAALVDADLPASAFTEIYAGRNLLVRGAKPKYLLALKIMAYRGKDIEDILFLAKILGISSASEMVGICDEVFTGTVSYLAHRQSIEMTCNEIEPLLRECLAGKNVGPKVAALASAIEGTDIIADNADRRERRRQRRENRQRKKDQRKDRYATKRKCGAENRDGNSCTNPLPPPGQKCAAGHRRP